MADLDWRVRALAKTLGARLDGDGDAVTTGVYIDSREGGAGRTFVALVGERLDGHDFIRGAVETGAGAVLAGRDVGRVGVPVLVVEDTLVALQRLGARRRSLFEGPVAAVTGSSGKTTTRHILAALMSERWRTHSPVKNFNNHVGVPLTLCAIEVTHEAAVLELGCSGFGEIALLAGLTDPDVGLVTNVGPAHLEQLGDLDGVARAKGELFAGMRPDAVAVVNLDDPRVAKMPLAPTRKVTYGRDERAEIRLIGRASRGLDGQLLKVSFRGEERELTLPLIGVHNAANAVAAAAAASAMGISPEEIERGMACARPYAGRLELKAGPSGSIVIDDTYNANPASMAAALEALEEVGWSGGRLMVLADMLELGERSAEAHARVGRLAAMRSPKLLVTMGEGGAKIGRAAVGAGLEASRWVEAEDHERAAARVGEKLGEGDALLVKGSRGMRLERVVDLVTGGGG